LLHNFFYRCRACLQNHFCVGGERNVTGVCQPGFDCTGGILRVKQGFWSPIKPTDWHRNLTLVAFRCPNAAACAGGDFFQQFVGCSAGYQDTLCSQCSTGLVGRGGTCIRCHATALSVVALMLLPTTVLLIIVVLTAVLLQTKLGKSQVLSVQLCGLPSHSN
jgi:hypothetical protein